MLPTPAARQADRGMPNRDTAARRRDTEGRRHLEDSIALLPTTTAKDGAASRNRTCVRQPDAKYTIGTTLTDVAWLDAWGEYGTAIARHAATFGTPPPTPTVLGTKGQPALSPRFSEWMMAAPAGWVTELDIPRTEQLRILGNSIVGPCAVAAFAELLGRVGTSPESGA